MQLLDLESDQDVRYCFKWGKTQGDYWSEAIKMYFHY